MLKVGLFNTSKSQQMDRPLILGSILANEH